MYKRQGTQTGLDRFDGINVKSFLQFSGRTIFSIAEPDSVYLWVGTDKGLWMAFSLSILQAKEIKMSSPDGKYQVTLSDEGGNCLLYTSFVCWILF